tara:strand:+ start:308 stop:985 length:678 start_codon:yes stop_codon:yes gene_type:complete
MHQQTDKKKIILYIFFFLILSTINNVSLKNYNFSEIKKINVSGLSIQENNDIKKEIGLLDLENIFFLTEKDIYKIIEKNSAVENFYVKKKYPFELDIKISKTNFLGNIFKDEKNYLIGSNSKLTFTEIIDDQLPTVFGNPEIKEFIKFKKIIEISNFEFDKISEFYFQKSKRWDIKTTNGVLIKFPRKNIQEAISQTYDILNSSQFSNMKTIDLRIEDQVIINDK